MAVSLVDSRWPSHFNQVDPFAQMLLYLRPTWFKPGQQVAAGGIAKPYPDHLRTVAPGRGPDGEVAILGDDDAAVPARGFPDGRVADADLPDIKYMGSLMATIFDPMRQRRRQLRIDQKLHAAMTAVSPIAAAA